MASSPVIVKQESIEDLLVRYGQIEAEMERRLAQIQDERKRKRERIQQILAEAGLSESLPTVRRRKAGKK